MNTLPDSIGNELLQRLQILARNSAPGPGVTRLPFTSHHHDALVQIKRWMEQAGLTVNMDAAGTLIGRYEPETGSTKPTLMMGSHQDSIRHGGAFDGALGVLLPIIVLEYLPIDTLSTPIEVLCFADEEGVRFPTALMGPRTLAGTFDNNNLSLRDSDGVSVREALDAFGGDSTRLASLRRNRVHYRGYVEVHIEQGPVLDNRQQSAGVVSGICGIERWQVTLTGTTGHAGTLPMQLRQDALAGAAEIILFIEQQCQQISNLVGTVGSLHVLPNVVNTVPGEVRFTVELRSPDDTVRERHSAAIAQRIKACCTRRRLSLALDKTYSQRGVLCDAALTAELLAAATEVNMDVPTLMSGATHDASAMADLCPVGMLFVRCAEGISHRPEESVTATDLRVAAQIMAGFLTRL